jgi:cytochrome c oxidase assembly protein subunit 15
MTDPLPCRWLHRWSVLTVCATFVLLGLGSVVTNLKAGMADPTWPTKPTALADFTPEQWQNTLLVIEHTHRLAGYVVGCCAIVLAVWLWLGERRRWVCWLGTAALLGVCVQGLIGGLRVTENVHWGLEFRIIHGSFAPVVFSLLMAVAVVTSRSWGVPPEPAVSPRLRRGARHVLLAVYAQVVLGAWLRHTYSPLAQRAHLLVAFVAALGVVMLVRLAWASGDRPLRLGAAALAVVLGLQVMIGVETWMAQFSHYRLPDELPLEAPRVAIRTAHVLGGALLLSVTTAVTVLTRRAAAAMEPSVPETSYEEAAA